MTVEDALRFFQNMPAIAGKLQTLVDVGLSLRAASARTRPRSPAARRSA